MPRQPTDQLSLFAPSQVAPPARKAQLGAAPPTDDLRAVASVMPPSLRLGTSSWSFPGWNGIVYDREASTQRLARDGLAAYAQHPLLRTVGIDRTFYAPVNAGVFADYAAQVPTDFRFLIKAHEACTLARYPQHPRYGAQRGLRNELFLHAGYAAVEVVGPVIDGLGDKAGPILFQFPPQDIVAMGGPTFPDRLHTFLAALPRGPLYAVEIRSAALLTPEYFGALRDVGACHCLNWHPTMPAIHEQERWLTDEAAPALVIRWMLGHGHAYDEARAAYAPFARLAEPDPTARQQIAQTCLRSATRGKPTFVIINNKAEGSAPLSAFELARAIAAILGETP